MRRILALSPQVFIGSRIARRQSRAWASAVAVEHVPVYECPCVEHGECQLRGASFDWSESETITE